MKTTFFLVVFIIALSVCAQDKKQHEIDSLKAELKDLEKVKIGNESLKTMMLDIKKDIIINKEDNIETRQLAINRTENFFTKHFNIFMSIGLLIGVFLSYFGIAIFFRQKANEMFNKYLIEKFKITKDEEIITLLKEIESSGWKASLRSKKILILHSSSTTLGKDFEKAVEVFNPTTKSISHIKDSILIDFSPYTLVVLENIDDAGRWNPDDFKVDYLNLMNKICDMGISFIYYGKGDLPKIRNAHLVNFSNSPSTLYINIMNMLKFKDLLEGLKKN